MQDKNLNKGEQFFYALRFQLMDEKVNDKSKKTNGGKDIGKMIHGWEEEADPIETMVNILIPCDTLVIQKDIDTCPLINLKRGRYGLGVS